MAWDQTGTRFVYNASGNHIQLYDTATGTNQMIAYGWSPVFSPDNRYIAYETSDRLMVYDLQTQRGWECYRSGWGGLLQRYTFSPDSRYIAVWDSYSYLSLSGGSLGYLYAVDIHTGAKAKLMKSYRKPLLVWQ
jgi:WD40 repeat protein